MAKLPFVKFFPRDWMGDEKLRLCSVAARGLWIDMLCLMHSAHRRGYLQTATGSPLPLEQIARVAGCSTDEATRLLSELKDAGVYDCSGNGAIFSRRMVRENDISQVRSANGHKGATKTNEVCRGKSAGKTAAKGPAKSRPSDAQSPRGSEGNNNASRCAAAEPPPAAANPPADSAPPAEPKPELKPESKPKAPAQGPHHAAIRVFCEAWQRKYGVKYPFEGGKDAKSVQAILNHLDGDAARFADAVERYIAEGDEFVVEHRHSLSLFRSQLARYLVDVAVVPQPHPRSRFETQDDRVMGTILDALET